MRPAMRLVSEIIDLREVDAGASVGYASAWRAKRPSRIATIPIGYADGLSQSIGATGSVLCRGTRVRLAGRISMDLSTIDVTDVPAVSIGDEIVLLGRQEGPLGRDTITAEELGHHAGAVSQQVLAGISARVPRVYVG
jgi:alanine racemase